MFCMSVARSLVCPPEGRIGPPFMPLLYTPLLLLKPFCAILSCGSVLECRMVDGGCLVDARARCLRKVWRDAV